MKTLYCRKHAIPELEMDRLFQWTIDTFNIRYGTSAESSWVARSFSAWATSISTQDCIGTLLDVLNARW